MIKELEVYFDRAVDTDNEEDLFFFISDTLQSTFKLDEDTAIDCIRHSADGLLSKWQQAQLTVLLAIYDDEKENEWMTLAANLPFLIRKDSAENLLLMNKFKDSTAQLDETNLTSVITKMQELVKRMSN